MTRPRIALFAIGMLAFVAGVLAPGPILADPGLCTLLRFMAVIKGGMALGALALVAWRLGRPIPATGTAIAFGGVALMAAATGLIWSLAHVALGAMLFHVGLFALLVLAWREGMPRRVRGFRAAGMAQRRITGTATSFLRRNGSVQGGS